MVFSFLFTQLPEVLLPVRSNRPIRFPGAAPDGLKIDGAHQAPMQCFPQFSRMQAHRGRFFA